MPTICEQQQKQSSVAGVGMEGVRPWLIALMSVAVCEAMAFGSSLEHNDGFDRSANVHTSSSAATSRENT